MSVPSESRKVPLLRLFGRLLIRPGSGVAAILDGSPSVTAIALALIPVGLLRGAVEGLWYYLMTGRGDRVLTMLADPTWYTRYGGPYLSDLSGVWPFRSGRSPGGPRPW